MRLLCIVVLLIAITASASAFNIQGHITGGTGFALRYVWGFPTTFDTILVTIAIPYFNTYTLAAPEGSYMLLAYQDLNGNVTPDLDEPRGFYGGQPPQLLVLSSDTSGIDIDLQPPNTGGFTGVVSYSGTNTGATFITAHRSPAFSDSAHGIGFLLNRTGSGSYTCFVDSFGIYYAYAFMDLNSNFVHDPDEPYGIYGGSTPQAISVQPTTQTAVAGNNVTLSVTTAGNPAPSYQWRKDGVAISGATSSSLTLSSLAPSNAGSYSVVVTNSAGSVTSSAAVVESSVSAPDEATVETPPATTPFSFAPRILV